MKTKQNIIRYTAPHVTNFLTLLFDSFKEHDMLPFRTPSGYYAESIKDSLLNSALEAYRLIPADNHYLFTLISDEPSPPFLSVDCIFKESELAVGNRLALDYRKGDSISKIYLLLDIRLDSARLPPLVHDFIHDEGELALSTDATDDEYIRVLDEQIADLPEIREFLAKNRVPGHMRIARI